MTDDTSPDGASPSEDPEDPDGAGSTDGEATEEAPSDEYLPELPDGAGCAEIWDRISESREDARSDT